MNFLKCGMLFLHVNRKHISNFSSFRDTYLDIPGKFTFVALNLMFINPVKRIHVVFSSPVQSTGRAIVVTLSSALALAFPSRHF